MSTSYGLDNITAVHLYAVDFDQDSYTDLVVLPDYFSTPEFYRYHNKLKKFKKLNYNPFTKTFRASFLNFADVNKDGLLDVFVVTMNQKTELTTKPLILYIASKKNGKINYQKTSELKSKYPRPTASVALIDYDLDGNLDLFEGNWFRTSKGVKSNSYDRLFKGDKTSFKEVTYLLRGEMKYNRDTKGYENARATFGTSICDVDKNGFPDILTVSSSGQSNKLWLNLYDSKHDDRIFKDYGKESNYAQDRVGSLDLNGGGNTFFSLCTDYNNSGVFDILVGELFHSYDSEKKDRSSFLTGATESFPPKFLRSEYVTDPGLNSWSHSDRRGVFSDFNNDGLVDFIVDNSGFPPNTRMLSFFQNEDHSFDNKASDYGLDIVNPSGSVTLDIDRDGRMDILTTRTNLRNSLIQKKIYLFKNEIPKKNKTFRFYLRAKKANTYGIGSLVEFVSTLTRQKRIAQYNFGGLPSQIEEGFHFAVPNREIPVWVNVRWPIVKKDGTPLVRSYDLEKISYKSSHNEFTLCEDGRILKGKRDYCR